MSKVNTKLTEEEVMNGSHHTFIYSHTYIHAYMNTYGQVEERKAERKYGDIDMILGRRKNGRTMEYECTFVGQVSATINRSHILYIYVCMYGVRY